MLVLSTGLTSGQITFIFRIIIQLLSYGGIFLIGLIILGNSPRSALKETHDVLNRVVGKSTATSTVVKWIIRQIFKKSRDPAPAKSLLLALLFFTLYGSLASLSDIGFLGLKACTVPYPSVNTFPASIQTEADARALVGKNFMNGTDPKLVKFHQCDSASNVFIGVNSSYTRRICSQWHNTTYDDPTLFRSLNLTDSDTLMYKHLVNSTRIAFDTASYYVGSSNHVVLEPMIRDGLAILPHTAGVKLVVGAPALAKNQVVDIPKTMAVEVEIGCLSVGVYGDMLAGGLGHDWLITDSFYKPTRRSTFSGPEFLLAPLQTAADAVRTLILPAFDTPRFDTPHFDAKSGSILRLQGSSTTSTSTPTLQTQIDMWYPTDIIFNFTDTWSSILADCDALVHKAVNASGPPLSFTRACGFYQLTGTRFEGDVIYQGYNAMVCASATAINMVSAKLEIDNDGRMQGQVFRLPSDLNIVHADYFDRNRFYGGIGRYTLSDNPLGHLQHYIYQPVAISGYFAEGAASPGDAISQVGAGMVAARAGESVSTLLIVDSDFFSLPHLNDSDSMAMVTKWAGGYGASYFFETFSMNGFAALDKPRLVIKSTGGRVAVCYKTPYSVAFIPFMAAALVVILWSLQMLVSSRLRDTKQWEVLYGGLVPTSLLDKHSPNAMLVWDETDMQPHLRPLKDADDGENETATMLSSATTI